MHPELASPKKATIVSVAVGVGVLAAAYLVSGRLGLELAHYQTNTTLIWPPTGLSIAALVLFGRRLWPGVFIGAVGVNVLIGTPLLPALGISIGNTLEAVIGSLILVRWTGFDPALARARDVLVFGAAAATASCVSASVGASSLFASGVLDDRDPLLVWALWWLGDMGGALLVAPLVFVFARGAPSWRVLATRKEAWVVLALTLVGGLVAFGSAPGDEYFAWALPAVFLPFVCAVWAGLRLGPRGAVGTAAIAAFIAVVGTGAGAGPFVGQRPDAAMLLSWAYATSLGLVGAILAAALAERDAAQMAREAEEERRHFLEEQVVRAEHLERLGLLAGGIAHDFNNLLMVMQGNVELLRLFLSAEHAQAATSVSEIELATHRAARLCRQLLDYAGRNSPNSESLSLRQSAEEAVGLVRGSIPRRIRLEVDVPDTLPRVEADATQANQILMNLLLNASEAIGAAEGVVRIGGRAIDVPEAWTVGQTTLPPGPYVELLVTDDGPGMDEVTRRRVFEPFFSTKDGGRGLGLASVAGIVRAHGGAVRVESTPDEGTEFSILLPASEHEAPDAEARVTRASPELRRVLVADDDPAVLRVLEGALCGLAAEVIAVDDGQKALDVLSRETFDVAVLDVDMPRLDGVQVVRALRESGDRTPVLLVTGRPSERLEELREAYLLKPFKASALADALRTVVAESG